MVNTVNYGKSNISQLPRIGASGIKIIPIVLRKAQTSPVFTINIAMKYMYSNKIKK